MRDLTELDEFRQNARERELYGFNGDSTCGIFAVRSHKLKNVLNVIASSGEGWDHVSVSLPHRCPSWDEMEHVKRLFFRDDECAMQLHVPPTSHISIHPFCLHIWRPQEGSIPLPPSCMVGTDSQVERLAATQMRRRA